MSPPTSPTPESVASFTSATLVEDEQPRRLPPEEDLARGQVVGRYVILERVGAGGMGVVYAAYDRDLDRRVAIKVLRTRSRPALSRGSARLLREAQAMARLAHPNVVAVHEVGTFLEHPFVAMEFVDGQTLAQWLDERARPWREVVAMLLQAGRGLAAAHAQGLVHRDFKPDNVLVGRDGRARVLDFGLARSSSESSQDEPLDDPMSVSSGSNSISQRLTETGALAGTPAYMAPELFRGQPPSPCSDLFALCVTAWEALYGERPFTGENRAQLAMAVCNGELRDPPPTRDVPAFLRRALRRGLATEPEDRFSTVDELLAALERDPVRRRRHALLTGLAAAAIATTSAVAARWSGPTEDNPCDEATSRLAGVWGDEPRAALRDAFARVEADFASASLETVSAELDHYAQRWVESHRDACEATHVRHEQSTALLDRRMACLERRRSALAATTSLLAEADREAIARSVQAVSALPSIDECDDPERMMARFAPPNDAAVAERVEALRTRLARASAMGLTGRSAEGLADALAARREATRLEHPPLDAEIALTIGELSYSAGQPMQAQRWLHAAVDEAIASGHDEVLVSAATRLISIEGVSLSRYEEAERWGRLAEAAVRRRGRDMEDVIVLGRTRCMMLADKGDSAAALPHCREAVELSVRRYGPEHATTGQAFRALGNALLMGGEHEAAADAYQRASALFLRSHGVDHPAYPALLNSLSAVCHAQGHGEVCLKMFEETVRAAVRSFGPEHPAVADFTNNLAIVLHELGRLDEAEEHARRSLRLRRTKFGDDHPGVGAAHRVLAEVALDRGDLPQAAEHADRAVGILRATRGEDHPDVLAALGLRARVRLASGEVDQGLADLEAALASAERLDRPPLERAELRFALARALAEHRPRLRDRAQAIAAAAQGEAGDTPLAAEIAEWRAAPDPAAH